MRGQTANPILSTKGRIISLLIKPLFIVTLAIGLAAGVPAQTDQVAAPKTTTNPGIPLDELKTEADSWQALVKKAAENVAETKLRINQKIGLDENGKEKEDVAVYRRYTSAVGGISWTSQTRERQGQHQGLVPFQGRRAALGH